MGLREEADTLWRRPVQPSMQGAGPRQHELRHRRIEGMRVLGHAEEGASHRAMWRGQACPAGVFERFAGLEQRLVPHHGQAGVVFNPAAPIDVLGWVIDKVDLVLLMSVNPGFGGQSFIDSALRTVERARKLIDATGREIRLEVDGGIKVDNIRAVADAGADTFVAGSAIFGQPDYKAVIDAMRARLAA